MKAKIKIKTIGTETTKSGTIDITGLRESLGLDPRTKIFIMVPTGGDYSGHMLEIGQDVELEFQEETCQVKNDD